MRKVHIHEAGARLSELLRAVEQGGTVVITRSGKAVARLVPAEGPERRILGADEGMGSISGDFEAPLPPAELRRFLE